MFDHDDFVNKGRRKILAERMCYCAQGAEGIFGENFHVRNLDCKPERHGQRSNQCKRLKVVLRGCKRSFGPKDQESPKSHLRLGKRGLRQCNQPFAPLSAKTFCALSKALWGRSADLTSVPGGLAKLGAQLRISVHGPLRPPSLSTRWLGMILILPLGIWTLAWSGWPGSHLTLLPPKSLPRRPPKHGEFS